MLLNLSPAIWRCTEKHSYIPVDISKRLPRSTAERGMSGPEELGGIGVYMSRSESLAQVRLLFAGVILLRYLAELHKGVADYQSRLVTDVSAGNSLRDRSAIVCGTPLMIDRMVVSASGGRLLRILADTRSM